MVVENKLITIILCLTIAYSQTSASFDSIEPSAVKNASLSSIVANPMFYPPNPTPSKCCTDNTISVSGSATIQASPDLAILNAQMTASGNTVQ